MNKRESSPRYLSVRILEQVYKKGLNADDLISKEFRRHRLKQEDKALITELVNGTLRWRGQLDWILERFFRGDFKDSPIKLRSILELSLYQIRFLNKIPKYAAVSEGVEMAKEAGGKAWGNLVNAVLQSYLRREESLELPSLEADAVAALAFRYSHPSWMVQRWLNRFGLEATQKLCEFNNCRPAISLRINLKKTSREALLTELKNRGIDAQPSDYFDDFIKIQHPHDLTQLPSFTAGLFSIQDESTAIPSLLLNPAEGDIVLDLCAAPGGKAGHLAHLMGDSGKILAVDRNLKRLKLLKQNIERLKVESVILITADSTNFYCAPVDKILLDAPCSGLGVLAKRSDLRWKRTLEDIINISQLQKIILQNAGKLLKPGGALVYSTCTIEPEENEEVIEEFLDKNKDFQIDKNSSYLNEVFYDPNGFWTTLPHKHEMDGTFAVRMVKTKEMEK